MDKSPEAFRTISEVAETLDTPAHVLRFWETRFPQVRPVKRAGGRRYYRPSDVALLSGIKRLLHDEGMTIRGVQKILREQGIRHVAALGSGQAADGDDGQTIEAELSAALGPAADDGLPVAEAETAQVIALETVLARADRAAAPVQPGLWDSDPAAADPSDLSDEDVAEAPMIEMAEPEPAEAVTAFGTAPDGAPDAADATGAAPPAAGPADDEGAVVADTPEPTDTEQAEPVAARVAESNPPPSTDAPTEAPADQAAVESDPLVESPTLAARLRALPRGALADRGDAVAELQDRILTLRSRLAEAAGRRVR